MSRFSTGAYLRMAQVATDGEALLVAFENGETGRIEFSRLRPSHLRDIQWRSAYIDEGGLRIIVPAEPHEFEISWDLVRRITDPEFSAEMAQRAEKQARMIGLRLRDLRLRRGLTQAQLASMARVEQANLSRIENGRFDISASTLWKLLDAMGFSPADLATANDLETVGG